VFNKKILLLLLLPLTSTSLECQAKTSIDNSFYVGAIGGYGATTWEGLVPTSQNQNLAVSVSTPISVTEGGGVWGLFTGYEFTPYFALEASYMSYQTAEVFFDPATSLFSYNHNGSTEFSTDTETVSLMGKIMLIIPKTKLRVFSSAGAARIHRVDILDDEWHLSPTFGIGVNCQLSSHFMAELGGNYTAGFGESQLNPADSYIPFLYSASLRLAYMF
jgi:hypothetical protein